MECDDMKFTENSIFHLNYVLNQEVFSTANRDEFLRMSRTKLEVY